MSETPNPTEIEKMARECLYSIGLENDDVFHGADKSQKKIAELISTLTEEHRKEAEALKKNLEAQEDDHLRLTMYRESHATSKKLIEILQNYCGESGENEGAVETLERKLKELSDAKAEIEKLKHDLDHMEVKFENDTETINDLKKELSDLISWGVRARQILGNILACFMGEYESDRNVKDIKEILSSIPSAIKENP